jgi:hypothetical protein
VSGEALWPLIEERLPAHYKFSRLVPKLLLGDANFNPSSAWRSIHVASNKLKLANYFAKQELARHGGSQAGAWEPAIHVPREHPKP